MSSSSTTDETFLPVSDSLVQYIEVWLPNEDQSQLIHTASAHSGQGLKVADGRRVRVGEGVAGAAWNQKAATILQEAPSELLESINHEAGTELAAVVAVPVFRQQELTGVVVLGISHSHGAIEIWSRDDRDELAVTSGHYSGLPSFEFITRYTRFPKGAGVPGSVWQSGNAQIAQNLETSAGFIRSFGNDPARIASAVGLPVSSAHGFPASVLMLLNTEDTPLSGRTQLWNCVPAAKEHELEMPGARIEVVNTIGSNSQGPVTRWQATILEQLSEGGGPLLTECRGTPLPDGATFCLSIPVYRQLVLSNVLNLMF